MPLLSIARKKGIVDFKNVKWCTLPLGNINEKEKIPFGILDITHPSIVYFANGWKGFTHWLAATPYPNSLFESGEPYENTCIFMANGNAVNSNPISFGAINKNPIISLNEAQYNSDPDLFYDKDSDKLYCITRKRRSPGYVNDIVLQSSVDGFEWSAPVSIIKLQHEEDFLSPCLISFNDHFRIYTFQLIRSYPSLTSSMDIWESLSIQNPDFKLLMKVPWKSSVNIWHGGLFEFNKKWYLLSCGSHCEFRYLTGQKDNARYLFLGESSNGIDFKMYQRPLVKMNGLYRPSGFVDENGKFACYVSFHNRYSGDKSYPAGNRIGLIEYPFQKLLQELAVD